MKTNRTDNVRGYNVDFVNETITINFKFQKAAMIYGSAEYNRLKALIADFPTFKVQVLAGKVITKARPTKRLTYKNMETYIGTYENADELMAQFNRVKAESQPLASPYTFVREWFVAQFPNYNVVQINDTGAKKAAVAVVEPNNPEDYPHKAA